MESTMNEPELLELLAKQRITEVIHLYARAIDRMDEDMLRSVFHPGSRHRHFYEGPSSDPSRPSRPGEPGDFVAFAMDVLRTHSATHHQLGNVLIKLTGADSATAETYFTAHHRMRPLGDPLAAPNAFDTPMDFFVGGRYLDRFERRDGVWRIVERVGMTDWARVDGPSSAIFRAIPPDTIGQRAPDDMVYRFITV
jgi:hypothetical protein